MPLKLDIFESFVQRHLWVQGRPSAACSKRASKLSRFSYIAAAKRYREDLPDLADQLSALLREAPTRSTPLRRKNGNPVPVDIDSRLHLVRLEHVTELLVEPIFSTAAKTALTQLVQERTKPDRLTTRGLAPTRSSPFRRTARSWKNVSSTVACEGDQQALADTRSVCSYEQLLGKDRK